MIEIQEYEWSNAVLDGSQYFSGGGVYGTRFERSYVGAGETTEDACEDALNQLVTDDYDVEHIEMPEWASSEDDAHVDCDLDDEAHDACEMAFFVALYVK